MIQRVKLKTGSRGKSNYYKWDNKPNYTVGKCVNCGEYGDLGNGLCVKCWDIQTNNKSVGGK